MRRLFILSLSLLLALTFVITTSVSVAGAKPPPRGTWTNTGNMDYARGGHTATLLRNGEVLIVGGLDPTSNTTNSCDIYKPAKGTWSPAASMTYARLWHTATLLSNGMVLVTGGGTSACELYDPHKDVWLATDSLDYNRIFHTATLLPDGRVLVAGGLTVTGGGLPVSSSAELFNPKTGTWSSTGSMSTPRRDHTATLLPDGNVLVAGGYDGTASLNSAEVYNPATGTWTPAGSMTNPRSSHTATLLDNGIILVTGGFISANNVTQPTASCELYNPATSEWIAAADMHYPRGGHNATLLRSGEVLVTGTGNASTMQYTELLNEEGVWISTDNLNTGRTGSSATLVKKDEVLVAGGGDINLNALASAELFRPSKK